MNYFCQPSGINFSTKKLFGTSSITVPKVSFHRFKKPNKEITETISMICSLEKYSFNLSKCSFLLRLGAVPEAKAKSNKAFSLSSNRLDLE